MNKQQQRKNNKPPKGNNKPRRANPVVKELERIILGQKLKVKPNNGQRRPPRSGKIGGITDHPLYRSVVGIISPFSGVKGSVSGFADPRPSQKFCGRGLVSYQIPAGEEFMAFVFPCILNDSGRPSMVVNYGTTANMALATSTFTSSTAANTPLNISQQYGYTATPYNESTLNTAQNNWRLLSAGVRVRWTGANLYRGGLFKYYHDTRGDLITQSELTGLTFSALASRLDSHAGIVRHNLADIPEMIVNLPSVTDESQVWAQAPQYWPGNQEFAEQRYGGTTSAQKAGQPIAYIYGVNTTGQSMYFDAELVEHWEICGRNVDALNTPSCGNTELANSLSTLVVSTHQHLSHNPNSSYSNALKSCIKDPHVRGAFTGLASQLVTAAIAAL